MRNEGEEFFGNATGENHYLEIHPNRKGFGFEEESFLTPKSKSRIQHKIDTKHYTVHNFASCTCSQIYFLFYFRENVFSSYHTFFILNPPRLRAKVSHCLRIFVLISKEMQ